MIITLDFDPVEKASVSRKNWSALLQVLGASLFIALCSQVKISLPFTPVPLTLQTFAVLLIGAKLGSRGAAYAVLAYFAQILMGLPVLAGGVADPLVFLGPKGGYVLGWLVQAYCMGWVVERAPVLSSKVLFLGGCLACFLEMSLGVWSLAPFVGWQHVLAMGVYPFIPGEILKVLSMCFLVDKIK